MHSRGTFQGALVCALLLVPCENALAENIFEGPIQEIYRPDAYIWDGAVADFNNDGFFDFIISYSNPEAYEVFLNDGSGMMTSMGICASPLGRKVLCGDLNEDGNVDIILVYGKPDICFGNGDGTFGTPVELEWQWSGYPSLADLNDDNHLDVVSGCGDSIHVFLGDGLGSFEKHWGCQTGYVCISTDACDLDLDGIKDLFCSYHDEYASTEWGIVTFKGNGDGTFMEPDSCPVDPPNTVIKYISAGDFNEDSYPDIAGSGPADLDHYAVGIFINQQDGSFLPSDSVYYDLGGEATYGLASKDFDLDGHLDLSVSGISQIMPGYGNGYFSNDPEDLLFGEFGGSLRPADLDNDGDQDLFRFFVSSHKVYLYRNTIIQQDCEDDVSGCDAPSILSVSPNPCCGIATIRIENLPASENPELLIYDLDGRLVSTISGLGSDQGELQYALDTSGLAAGVYLLRASMSDPVLTANLVIMNQ